MALIPCPDCKKMISPSTPQCPKCGCQITEEYKQKIAEKQEKNRRINKKIMIGMIIAFFAIAIIGNVIGPKTTKKSVSIQTIAEAIEKNLDGFDGCEIDTEDKTITVSIWNDGIAESVLTLKNIGADETNEMWVKFRDSFRNLEKSMEDICTSNGRDDINIILNVVNDANKDNTLMVISDGAIIYDVME